MMNNPFWRRSMIRQAYRLAATRVTAIALAVVAAGALCAVGVSALPVI